VTATGNMRERSRTRFARSHDPAAGEKGRSQARENGPASRSGRGGEQKVKDFMQRLSKTLKGLLAIMEKRGRNSKAHPRRKSRRGTLPEREHYQNVPSQTLRSNGTPSRQHTSYQTKKAIAPRDDSKKGPLQKSTHAPGEKRSPRNGAEQPAHRPRSREKRKDRPVCLNGKKNRG